MKALKKMLIFAIIAAILVFNGSTISQENTIIRQYVPIVIKGEQFPVQNFSFDAYHAYKFDAMTGTWTPIPCQFDEVDDNGLFTFPGDALYDGLVDADDEFIFMPEDIGDRALTSDWLEDAGSQQNTRLELELIDPSNPAQKGWIYLFTGLDQPPDLDNAIEYVAPPDTSTASDTIKTANYILGHNDKGWMDFALVRGIEEKDLLDRLKLHLRGELDLGGLGKYPYNINEEVNLANPKLRFYSGKVRGLREYQVDFSLPPLLEEPFSYIMAYSPYSTFIGTQGIDLSDSTVKEYLPILGVKTLRQSVDLSKNAQGMRFYNPANPQGIEINGLPDVLNDQIALSPDHAWMLATGQPGTLVSMMEVPPIGENQTLYYYDDLANLAIPDGSDDTGDSSSIGDMGILFTIGDSLEGLVISIDLSFFFLPPTDNPMTLGENLRQWVNQPLDVTITDQSKTPVSVTGNDQHPTGCALKDVYPNPYDIKNGSARFRFSPGPEGGLAVLRIYNTLGQEVMRFDRQIVTGSHSDPEITWNGRDFDGRLVPAGVYMYRLEVGQQSSTKKLLLIR